ncbi:hypothetical protein GCM10027290_05450 [Micromonospora sonneratiae]
MSVRPGRMVLQPSYASLDLNRTGYQRILDNHTAPTRTRHPVNSDWRPFLVRPPFGAARDAGGQGTTTAWEGITM